MDQEYNILQNNILMKRAIVTGGAGFIGSHIVDLLISEKYNVIIIDNLRTGQVTNINHKASFYNADLSDFEKIKEIFKKENPNFVFHLAAMVNLRESLKNPLECANQNILNTLNLLELSIQNNIEHFIFSSTGGAIYGESVPIPTEESAQTLPISPYGCSKYAIEKYLIYYNRIHNLKFTALRYSNVYGPRQNPEGETGVISIFFEKMFNNQSLTINGGIQTRDFVYVKDVARANLLALKDTKSSIYNIGTSKETDIIEIFNKINKYFKEKFTPEYKPMITGEQKRSCLSYEKIKNNLGWKPLTTLTEGLNNTYCWFLKNKPTTL
jgi:UDP-glucose 4-epimerase